MRTINVRPYSPTRGGRLTRGLTTCALIALLALAVLFAGCIGDGACGGDGSCVIEPPDVIIEK